LLLQSTNDTFCCGLGLLQLRSLELSDTEVGSNGLRHLSGLRNLHRMNLSFTLVTDIGLKKIAGLNSLKSLNLDNRQVTDHGLAALTSMSLIFCRSWDEGWIRSQNLLFVELMIGLGFIWLMQVSLG
jgi:hypothetical protein